MNAKLALIFPLLGLAVSGCDLAKDATQKLHKATENPEESVTQQQVSYSDCLITAIRSGSQFSAEDIRSLCAEATNTIDPSYKWDEGELRPSNVFTRCYDAEKRKLVSNHVDGPERLAKLSCKYPDAK